MHFLNIESSRILLRTITVEDIHHGYLNWMNNPETNQFLESRFSVLSSENLKSYILETNSKADTLFLAIIDKKSNTHIGNIKLGPINPHHHYAEIGLIIGEQSFWGKGYATESIDLLCTYAFENLKLHKITAGMYSNNHGSYKAFLKAGFHVEGTRKQHFVFNDQYVDYIMVGRFNKK